MTRDTTLLEPIDPFDGEIEPEETVVDVVDLYVSGLRFQAWEDPDRPFGCTATDLAGYLEGKAWVLLFNAVALTMARLPSDVGS